MVLEQIGEFRSELWFLGNFGLGKSRAMEATKTSYRIIIIKLYESMYGYRGI